MDKVGTVFRMRPVTWWLLGALVLSVSRVLAWADVDLMRLSSSRAEAARAQILYIDSDWHPMSQRDEASVQRLLVDTVLTEGWDKICNMRATPSDANLPAEYRAIKGHACLATNRSNESLTLFMSLLNDADKRSWQRWSGDFARRHPESAIALYLKGDALARLGRWREAETCFSRALQLDTQCYLAWNARGVTSHALGNTLMARMYFSKASKARQDFADAYASRGAMGVFLRSVREGRAGPETQYAKASRYSRDEQPVLVLLGLGCVKYGKQEYDESRKHYDKIPPTSCLSPLAQRDALMVEMAKLEQLSNKTGEVGTSVISQMLNVDMNYDRNSGGISDDEWNRIIQIAYEKLERLRQQYAEQCGGAAAASAFCIELQRQITELEEAIAEITGGRRDSNMMPVLNAVTDMVILAFDEINRATSRNRGRDLANNGQSLGGVDSDASRVRANRGRWKVSTVYGLLYPVPGLNW